LGLNKKVFAFFCLFCYYLDIDKKELNRKAQGFLSLFFLRECNAFIIHSYILTQSQMTSKDRQIFSKLQRKDKEAFIQVYELYADDIFRFIYFKVGDSEEAKDLASATFLKAWNYIQTRSLKSNSTLRALFYTIARNLVIDHYRAKKENVSLDEAIGLEADNNESIQKIDLDSSLAKVREQLPKLKSEYREVIILRFVEELDLDEISAITGKTKANVRVISHRALRALKELLEEQTHDL